MLSNSLREKTTGSREGRSLQLAGRTRRRATGLLMTEETSTECLRSDDSRIAIRKGASCTKISSSYRENCIGSANQGQSISPQHPGTPMPEATCETCKQAVSSEFAVMCCGCNQLGHAMCHSTLNIGERFYMKMCFCCTNHVMHLLRVSRGFERSFHSWREDEWFRTVLNAFRSASTMLETMSQALIVLQNFYGSLTEWLVCLGGSSKTEPYTRVSTERCAATEDAYG